MTQEVHDICSFMNALDSEIDVLEVVNVEAEAEVGMWSVDLCPKLTDEMIMQGIKKEDVTVSMGVMWHTQLPFVTIYSYAIIETATDKDFPSLATYLTNTINTLDTSVCMSKVGVVGFDSDVGMTVSFSVTLCMPLSDADSADKMEMLKMQFQIALMRVMVEANYGTVRMNAMFANTH